MINPSAEITPGYGLSTVQLKSGDMASGRLISENKKEVVLAALDGKETTYPRTEIAELSPPISAMPAMGATLASSGFKRSDFLFGFSEKLQSWQGCSAEARRVSHQIETEIFFAEFRSLDWLYLRDYHIFWFVLA